MNDVWLLSAMYMGGIQVKILNGETEINFGSVYENAVAQELAAHGFAPTYYNSSAHGEIDFVVERDGRILPIEVKSGKHYKRHRALAHMLDEPEFGLSSAVVSDDDALGVEGGVFYAPIYMMMFLEQKRQSERMIYCSEQMYAAAFGYSVSSDFGSRRKGMMPMKVMPFLSVHGFS